MKCDKISSHQHNDNSDVDKISENEISEITNNAVFKGGLDLLNNNTNTNKNKFNTNNNIPNSPEKKSKILQSLSKDAPSNPIIPNSSMFSSGYLSFRNKKARIQNPNPNQEGIMEEPMDSEAITKTILEKLRVGNQNKKAEEGEVLDINDNDNENDTNPSNNNTKFIYKNNLHSNKNDEIEFEEKEIKNIMKNIMNINKSDASSNRINGVNEEEGNNSSKDPAVNEDEWEEENATRGNEEEQRRERSRNVFKNLSFKGLPTLTKDEGEDDKDTIVTENDNEKYINSIICTLSLLEKGKAIFVSKDDLIFILPSLFVPRNLKVGNTYVFSISEYENYSEKIQQIKEIQNKYK